MKSTTTMIYRIPVTKCRSDFEVFMTIFYISCYICSYELTYPDIITYHCIFIMWFYFFIFKVIINVIIFLFIFFIIHIGSKFLQLIVSEFFLSTYIRELLGSVVGCVDGVNNHDAELGNGGVGKFSCSNDSLLFSINNVRNFCC